MACSVTAKSSSLTPSICVLPKASETELHTHTKQQVGEITVTTKEFIGGMSLEMHEFNRFGKVKRNGILSLLTQQLKLGNSK
jgi:hypothetical protein